MNLPGNKKRRLISYSQVISQKGIGQMSALPKLKITRSWQPGQEISDFEQARDSLFAHGSGMIILVEGHSIVSYEELLQIAHRDEHKDQEFLEVVMVPASPVGG
jgi:hypothetical protein